jgi:hypothetical protein
MIELLLPLSSLISHLTLSNTKGFLTETNEKEEYNASFAVARFRFQMRRQIKKNFVTSSYFLLYGLAVLGNLTLPSTFFIGYSI